MTEAKIVVPIDPGAPASAHERVAEWGSLFPSSALDTRKDYILTRLANKGIQLEGPSGVAVIRSLALGTVVEVALRLMPSGLDAQTLARLDAIAATVRIAQGLSERRGQGSSPLAVGFRSVADDLVREEVGASDLQIQLSRTLNWVARDRRDSPWTDTMIRTVASTQPLAIAVELTARAAEHRDSWYSTLSTQYAALAYLTRDLSLLIVDDPDTRVAGPISDLLAAGNAAASAALRSAANRQLQIMDAYASELGEIVSGYGDTADPSIIEYARITLQFAAAVFHGLEARGAL